MCSKCPVSHTMVGAHAMARCPHGFGLYAMLSVNITHILAHKTVESHYKENGLFSMRYKEKKKKKITGEAKCVIA